MGAAHDTTRTGWGAALIDVPTPTADVRTGRRVRSDVFVLEGLGTILPPGRGMSFSATAFGPPSRLFDGVPRTTRHVSLLTQRTSTGTI